MDATRGMMTMTMMMMMMMVVMVVVVVVVVVVMVIVLAMAMVIARIHQEAALLCKGSCNLNKYSRCAATTCHGTGCEERAKDGTLDNYQARRLQILT